MKPACTILFRSSYYCNIPQYIGSLAALILPVFVPVESFDRMVNAIICQHSQFASLQICYVGRVWNEFLHQYIGVRTRKDILNYQRVHAQKQMAVVNSAFANLRLSNGKLDRGLVRFAFPTPHITSSYQDKDYIYPPCGLGNAL